VLDFRRLDSFIETIVPTSQDERFLVWKIEGTTLSAFTEIEGSFRVSSTSEKDKRKRLINPAESNERFVGSKVTGCDDVLKNAIN
jgi:hypothetical protein